MGWKFNPFTGSLDQTGSTPSSYIDGEVATYNDLPLSSTTAPLDSAWLVRGSSGVWPFTKPGGVYVRTATGGSSRDADYTYAGVFPDVFSDANFTLYDDSDTSKNLKFQLSGISTGTTRTLTAPDANGTIARTEDFAAPPAIGSTTRNTGAFTTLNATNGTITASAPVLDLAQTWNASGVSFVGLRFDVTNMASATGSRVLHFTVGGTSNLLGIYRDSAGFAATPRFEIGSGGVTWNIRTRTGGGIGCNFDGVVGIATTLQFGVGTTTGVGDVFLYRDAADTLALGRTTNPQTFRLYNTFTDASNYERGFMRWSSNVLQIGTEKLGTGSARALELQTDGTSRLTISTAGVFQFGGTTSSFPAIKRSSTTLQVRLADDSAFAPLQCSTLVGSDNGTVATLGSSGEFRLASTGQLAFASRGAILMSADGVMWLSNNAGTSFGRLIFGGTTSSFPALKRSSTALQVRLGDDSGFATIDGQLQMEGTAPATSGATGTAGDIRYDADYIYVCTAANTWKRAAIATW